MLLNIGLSMVTAKVCVFSLLLKILNDYLEHIIRHFTV